MRGIFLKRKPVYSGNGRPPESGKVIKKPRELAEDGSVPWQKMCLEMYGKKVTLLVKTMQARRKNSGPDRVLTIVVTLPGQDALAPKKSPKNMANV